MSSVAMALLAALAAAHGASADDLLRAADAPRRVIEEGVVHLQVTLEVQEDVTTSDLDVLVQGGERALCIFRDGPLKERRILIAGEKTWLIVPESRRAIPITASQRLLGGASIADIARLWFADTFTAVLRPETETIDGTECRVLDLEARARTAPYGGGTLWIGADDLPRKAIFRLVSGKPAKEVLFTDYGMRDGRPILERMEIRHLLPSEKGSLTTIRYLGYEERRLGPEVFDPSGARQVP